MNVIFFDFDGVLYTSHEAGILEGKIEKTIIEERIKILADIAKTMNCKGVIESTSKSAIDEETMKSHVEWIQEILDLCKKYGFEIVGRTPEIEIREQHEGYCSIINVWKEFEILKYLRKHPEIEHFCIFDDDDMRAMKLKKSDLELVKDYLITTPYYSDDGTKKCILEEHKEVAIKILKKENKFKNEITTKKYAYLDEIEEVPYYHEL